MVIDFKNVSFKYTDKPILTNVNFTLTENNKVGLVGVNGTGKSTILKLIIGEEKPKSGEIIISGNTIISYLDQDPKIPEGISFRDYVLSFSLKDHEVLEYEANAILTKLKLDPNRIVDNLSGGEKKRLALAAVLVSYQDFLILDEPTNHLDNDMILYLEKYLIKYKRGLLIVTHDRYFLEKCCNTMLELDNGTIYSYKANYSLFLELKEKREEELRSEETRLKKHLKTELEWLHRGVEARRTKSKARIEKINEMQKITFKETKTFEFSSISSYLGKDIIKINNATKSVGGKLLFSDFSLDILRSDHIGIVGDNGCGKSTLFKAIMGETELDSGEIYKGETLKIGYFSQHFDLPNSEMSVLKYIEKDTNIIETLDGTMSAKTLLNKFLFDGELLYTPLKSLSGGEKRRLQLVKVLSQNPNMLILDEPTNDLDIYTISILENYIDSFIGPVLCVSHDRYFLDHIADKILYFDKMKINSYYGSFSEYLDNVVDNKEQNEKKVYVRTHTSLSSKDKKELETLEKEISDLETRSKELKEILKKNTTDYTILVDAQKELDLLESEYLVKSERYLELLELKERLENTK